MPDFDDLAFSLPPEVIDQGVGRVFLTFTTHESPLRTHHRGISLPADHAPRVLEYVRKRNAEGNPVRGREINRLFVDAHAQTARN